MSLAVVIDDDPIILRRLAHDFAETDVSLVTAETAQQGLDAIAENPPDVVLLDVLLPDLSGLETFKRIRERNAQIPVVFITTSSESSNAIEAMTLGAYDYLVKPLDSNQVRELVSRAVEIHRLMQTPVEMAEQAEKSPSKADVLIGRCAAMQEVYKDIGRVAQQDVTVLIQGESGTGKELVARAIYQHSKRAKGPFLAINCAAIPEALLESELFGHEKGAFTGADQRRIGKFEQCSGGTLFLDEIGDMSPATQSRILRLLQNQTFERVGGSETITTYVRIIAATNVDLEKAVEEGDFRKDLFYRLNVFTIQLPPLSERKDDLKLLVDHFVERFGSDFDKPITKVSDETSKLLECHDWPGNVRELQSVIKQALLQTTGNVLLPEFLPESLQGDSAPAAKTDAVRAGHQEGLEELIAKGIASGSQDLYAETLAEMERVLIVSILRHTSGNQLQAAKILGITRGSLRNKIRALGISIDRVISDD